MNYYTSEKVTDHITAVRSLSGEIMYLVEGEQKAVLIDTCVGVGHLRQFVEKLTDKQITVLLSHGHIDHAMGAPEFERVYMNRKDIPLYQSQCAVEERKGYVAAGIGPEAAAGISEEEYVSARPDYTFRKLEDGMIFDLGGVHVEAHEFEGHTKGCMIFAVREERVLILGDACNNATFLFDDICSTVAEYRQQVNRVKNLLVGKYDRVFLMHHVMEAPPSIFDEMSEVCDVILAGQADNIPFDFMGKKAYIAKATNERFEREDGKFANLIYNPEKVR
ncbi:MBL fold metallo-hydrolase [Roseburia hominis]